MNLRTSLALLALLPACGGEPQPPAGAPEATVASASPVPVASVTAAPAAAPPPVAAGQKMACPPALPVLKTESTVWGPLVRRGACWTLLNHTKGAPDYDDTLLVMPWNVRKVGKADVAQLKYTLGRNSSAHESPDDVLPKQVAVTDQGVWFLPADADDAAITAALRKPPTHAAKPKTFEPTQENGYTFVREAKTSGGPIVCAGHAIPPAQGNCGDKCNAMVCFSASNGVVIVEGTAAPASGVYAQNGFRIGP
ncbi:hypothetical protein [Polyangium sp. 15x6]|uniref:hypothetical protein n=1 Tax=Polyangium sp. 15x6 TaxID=3042687 RepID=UPI00249CEE9F|nr:hypothetical protein [Polyangium sp. 15x6]MDI3288727.1 hypothetical protein [Polyangium sp. 15x6]